MNHPTAIIYIPHGGGPLPLLGDQSHEALVKFLKQGFSDLPRPRAVVVISAHWEMDIPVATAHPAPDLIYDYFGFPREAYEIQYPAPGAPELAEKAVALLNRAGVKARTDAKRGFDHGLYIPLALMLPEARIPCIQISLCADLSPLSHLKMGEALSPLCGEDIWVLGSGFSFHNMAAFANLGQSMDKNDFMNQEFQDWLMATCANDGLTPDQRKERLLRWEMAHHARYCHPREEHLLPLMVCAGMAGYTRSRLLFDDRVIGQRALAFLWQKSG